MLVLLLGMVGGLVWGVLSLANGVDLRLVQQRNGNSGTQNLATSLVAQSFYVTRSNLDRVDLQMTAVPVLTAAGTVRLLEGDGLGGKEVYHAPLSATRFTEGLYQTVQFPPQPDSQGRTYTLVLETPGTSLGTAIGVSYNTTDVLSGGSMYTNEGKGKPSAGDLSFSLFYRYDIASLGEDTLRVLSEARRLVLSPLLLLLLPGLALLVWLPNTLTPGQKLIAAPGLTALSLPIFFLVTRALSVRVEGATMWGLLALCALLVLAGVWRSRPALKLRAVKPVDVAFWTLLGGVLVATLVSRFLSLRDLAAGVGLDAYHHTLISQMFVEAGGIPSSYAPYAPLSSFTYHFGFHSLAASIAWLSGRTSINDMLLLMPQAGQLADTLPVLTLTLLGWKMLSNRWAGLAAGALAGLFLVIPAFYVTWSRYTQGLGLAVLPLSWVLLLEVLDRPLSTGSRRQPAAPLPISISSNGTTLPAQLDAQLDGGTPPIPASSQVTWQTALRQSGPYMLAVIGASGLALTHYRITIIYAVFVALYLLWRLFRSVRGRLSLIEVLAPLRRVVTVAVLSGATLLPWLINLRQNFHVNDLDKPVDAQRCTYYDISSRLGKDILYNPSLFIITALSLGGIAWAIKRRDPLPLFPAITWILLTVWSNPCWAPVPFDMATRLKVGYLDSVTVVSGAWLPLCLMAGYTLTRFAAWVLMLANGSKGRWPLAWTAFSSALIGAVVLVCGLASGMQMSPVADNKPYVTASDLNVMLWMRGHLPANSFVLAEPFAFAWSRESVLGTDAGLWIPLVAGMRTSVPPMTAYNERLADPNYLKNTRNIIEFEPLRQFDTTNNPLPTRVDWTALKQAGVTHIFVGSRSEYFDKPFMFSHPDNISLLYQRDGTMLFALK